MDKTSLGDRMKQQDATRNSIQALAQSLYSQKQLSGLKCSQLQDKMFTEKGVNWNNLSTYQKRGACTVKRMMKKRWLSSETALQLLLTDLSG